jgi:hypothetical protein
MEIKFFSAGQSETACEQCGSHDVIEIAGQALCKDCIALAGCGCAGDGDDSGG